MSGCGLYGNPPPSLPIILFTYYYFDLRSQIVLLDLIGDVILHGLCPWDWSTRVLQYRRERLSLLDRLSEFGLISDGWLGSIISFGILSQCTWELKVYVLENGHTRHCSTSGSDPLRHSSFLLWALSFNLNNHHVLYCIIKPVCYKNGEFQTYTPNLSQG